MRTAIVSKGERDVDMIRRYLPDNYLALWDNILGRIVIFGTDNAGWTLDGYVIPRLQSGNIIAKELDY